MIDRAEVTRAQLNTVLRTGLDEAAIDTVLAHDAVLRAERDEYKRKYELVINDDAYGECCEIREKVEAERDALKIDNEHHQKRLWIARCEVTALTKERDALKAEVVRLANAWGETMEMANVRLLMCDDLQTKVQNLEHARDRWTRPPDPVADLTRKCNSLERELAKWNEPFDAELLADTERQASHKDSLAAQGVYIAALEHALKHLTRKLAEANEQLDRSNYENAHANETTRRTLFNGIKTRDVTIQSLEKQLAAGEQALKPLTELKITADQIDTALKRLPPIALRDEAYVKVAVETLIRIMRLKERQ